jgi:hypothetical protein
MTKPGLAAIDHVFDTEDDHGKAFKVPADILKAIKSNKDAWKHFQSFPESYVRVRIAYIERLRHHRKDLFKKTLDYFIKKTAQNKMYGSWAGH